MENAKQYRLPKEFATKWIAALRSGEYEQGDEFLISESGDSFSYCCLGVACVVSDEETEKYIGRTFIDFGKSIPSEIKDNAHHNDLVAVLTKMNDVEGKSFHEIADWIESNCLLY